MKKFFTLFAAALVVLSASAVPSKLAKSDKAQLPAIEKSFDHSRLTLAPAATTGIKKAPAATQDVALTVDDVQGLFYQTWEFDFFNGDDFVVYIDGLADGVDDTHIVGVYDLAECAGRIIPAAGDTTTIVSCTFEVAYDNGEYIFTMTALCDDGETYSLDYNCAVSDFLAIDYLLYYYYSEGYGSYFGISSIYDCLIELKDAPYIPVVVTDTVAVTFYPYYDSEGEGGWDDNVEELGWWQYQGETADMSLYITISPVYADQVAGTYTIDDMDTEFTYIYDEVARVSYDFESLNVVVTENGGVVTLTATGVCENGIYYIITCEMGAPTAVENVEVVKAQKSIENGQLIIIRNGERYDINGARL